SQLIIKNDNSSKIVEFYECTKRSYLQQLRGIFDLIIEWILISIAGIMLGSVFYNQVYDGPPPQEVIDACPDSLKELCSYPVNDVIMKVAGNFALALGLIGGMSSLKVFGR